MVRGFSPIQHALGRAPDDQGRFVQTLTGQAVEQLLPNAGPEFEQNIERMRIAEQAHSSWNAQQRIVRALNSRGNRKFDYRPGDLVFYWRKQLSGQRSSALQQKQGCFLGPARVLVTETKRDEHGCLHPGSSIWVIRGRRLIKCCPEQLRPATMREQLLEHLSVEDQNQAPWTFTRLTEGLGGNEYEDISNELPSNGEVPEDAEMEEPPAASTEEPRRRIHGKRVEVIERPIPERPPTRLRKKTMQIQTVVWWYNSLGTVVWQRVVDSRHVETCFGWTKPTLSRLRSTYRTASEAGINLRTTSKDTSSGLEEESC